MSGKMIIVAGPSAVGKSTFVARAIREIEVLEDTKTFTTRKMREGETEGDPYHHVTVEKFEGLLKENFFVEWAKVHTNMYGTPHYQIQEAWEKNRVIIMDVDVQGAKTFKSKFPQALMIFIHPPTIDELRQRLEKRDGKMGDEIELRLKNALIEIDQAHEFDHQITNDEFEKSFAVFKKIIEDYINTQ